MSNQIDTTLLAEMYGQESSDPLLMTLTMTHDSFGTIRLVNDFVELVSGGKTFEPFPFKFTLPIDDGETAKQLKLVIDNVSLELIDELRSITDTVDCKVEAVLASNPDYVQFSYEEMKLRSMRYNSQTIQADVLMDDFLNTAAIGEDYGPENFPGLF